MTCYRTCYTTSGRNPLQAKQSEQRKFNSRNTQPAARTRDARFFDFPSFSSRSVTATGSRGSRNGRCQASDALGDFALVEHREAQPDPRPQVPLLVPRLVRVIIILAIIIIASGVRVAAVAGQEADVVGSLGKLSEGSGVDAAPKANLQAGNEQGAPADR